ncbi:ribosome maturation factor RimP [Salinisphaera sp. P385]|uniref:Ribosome maturation factor RimP n=1 Tax=Spectribacter acetivorans TaxID=3075603 RepID=A0ABU3B515_9GAMM|nr:ribosome maturation factor RimP [Salinisphaera sp. P385]MDT0617235.1 ribosome maturation factor RimP [Salinisphaera sp. P385]
MAQRLDNLLAPVVEALGYELWHLETTGAGDDRLLRIYIDSPDGIALEDCEAVSHEVSAALDVNDPLPGGYRLEVSSPGMDRPLITDAHFARFQGETIRVNLYAAVDGRKRFTGINHGVVDDQLRIECDGELFELPRDSVAKARLVPVFD